MKSTAGTAEATIAGFGSARIPAIPLKQPAIPFTQADAYE